MQAVEPWAAINISKEKWFGLEDLEEEVWKDIVGWENSHQISNFGRVKTKSRIVGSIRHPCGYQTLQEKVLTLQLNYKGYYIIILYDNKRRQKFAVHRLVGLMFIPNPENKPQINHKNTIKIDNRVENLEWTTASENAKHAYKNNLFHPLGKGEENNHAKLTKKQVKEIRKSYQLNRSRGQIAKLGEKYNVTANAIGSIVNNITWKNV